MNTQAELEHIAYLSTAESFNAWLYENYAIGNGDMLLGLTENTNVQEIFLREHNLPLETEL